MFLTKSQLVFPFRQQLSSVHTLKNACSVVTTERGHGSVQFNPRKIFFGNITLIFFLSVC